MAFPFGSLAYTNSFREELHGSFETYSDTTFELIDALSSSNAKAAVELSLSPFFTRQYSSISQVVSQILKNEYLSSILDKMGTKLINEIKQSSSSNMHFYALDETSVLKPNSKSMDERKFVYGLTNGTGKVGIGHSYSYLVYLGKDMGQWVVPVDLQRVTIADSGISVGLNQFHKHISNQGNTGETNVLIGDSKYSSMECIHRVYSDHNNTLLLSRLNSVRSLSFQYLGDSKIKKYGESFKLNDESTWTTAPSDSDQCEIITARGKIYTVKLTRWNNLIVHGKRNKPMHQNCFDIVRVQVFKDNGDPVYYKSMWLMLAGKDRNKLSTVDIYSRYASRFNIEHFFRFSKQHLLLGKYETPDTPTLDIWNKVSALAYINSLACANLLDTDLLHPWQKQLRKNNNISTPYQVQRNLSTILQEIGSPANPCTYNSHGDGRAKGTILNKRGAHKPYKKSDNIESGKKPKIPDSKIVLKKSKNEIISVLELTKHQTGLLNSYIN